MEPMFITLGVLAFVVVLGLGLGVRTVPQGQVWTVEKFGAYTRLMQPGLNMMLPLVERVGHKMNVQEIVLDIPEQAVITRDTAAVVVDGIMYYRVLDPAKAAYGAQNLVQALTSMAMTNIRSVIGAMDLDGALSGREEINAKLLVTLDHATAPLGRQGQPRGAAQDRAAGQPGAGHEPADDRRARAPGPRSPARWASARPPSPKAEGQKQATVLQAEARLEAAMKDAAARERLAEAEAPRDDRGGGGRGERRHRGAALLYRPEVRGRRGTPGRQPVRPHLGDPAGDRRPGWRDHASHRGHGDAQAMTPIGPRHCEACSAVAIQGPPARGFNCHGRRMAAPNAARNRQGPPTTEAPAP